MSQGLEGSRKMCQSSPVGVDSTVLVFFRRLDNSALSVTRNKDTLVILGYIYGTK